MEGKKATSSEHGALSSEDDSEEQDAVAWWSDELMDGSPKSLVVWTVRYE